MELLPKPLSKTLNRYLRRRQYRRLHETIRRQKKVQVTRFHGAPVRRKWKIRAPKRLRILRFIGVSPFKLWSKIKSAYINMMINLAGNIGYLNTDNVFGGKRIPKSKPATDHVVYSGDEVERRLVIEIYKALQIIDNHHHHHQELKMEKDAFSPPLETNTAAPNSTPFAMALGGATPQNFPDVSTETRDFGAEFFSMYRSIFPQSSSPQIPSSLSLTPSTRSDDDEDNAFEHRLNQALLNLERQEFNDQYKLNQAQLHDLNKELEFLRHENAELRSVNGELLKLLSSPTAIRGLLLSSTNQSLVDIFRRLDLGGLSSSSGSTSHPDGGHGLEEFSDISPTSVMQTNRFERRNPDQRVSLPKSISVRSTGYQKANQSPAGSSREGPSRASTRPRTPSQSVSGTQRVYVPGVGGSGSSSGGNGMLQKEEVQENSMAGLELEVYNQGMFKTELCNKWQQTGACPYGDHCQFAHGFSELRPVIRHPRYKTEICRMVLSGDRCPYGHRCHFRHSLTDQERLLLPR